MEVNKETVVDDGGEGCSGNSDEIKEVENVITGEKIKDGAYVSETSEKPTESSNTEEMVPTAKRAAQSQLNSIGSYIDLSSDEEGPAREKKAQKFKLKKDQEIVYLRWTTSNKFEVQVHDDSNHIYRKCQFNKATGMRWFQCSRKDCSVQLRTKYDQCNRGVRLSEHNHPSDMMKAVAKIVIREVLDSDKVLTEQPRNLIGIMQNNSASFQLGSRVAIKSAPLQLGSTPILDNLPNEIIIKILKELDMKSLLCIGRTCLKLNQLSLDESVWKNLVQLDFTLADRETSSTQGHSSNAEFYSILFQRKRTKCNFAPGVDSCLPGNSVIRKRIARMRSLGTPSYPRDPVTPQGYCNIREDFKYLSHEVLKPKEQFLSFARMLPTKTRGSQPLLIFFSPHGIERLRSADQWMADGTFAKVPSHFEQMYVFHSVEGNQVFPAAWAFLCSKDKNHYSTVLKELTSRTKKLPQKISIDFEMAMVSVLREEYPTIDIDLCSWHLKQSLFRGVQDKGLVKILNSDIYFQAFMKQMHILIWIPPEDVLAVFEEIMVVDLMNAFITNNQDTDKISEFINYVRTTYVGYEENCVYKEGSYPIHFWNKNDETLHEVSTCSNKGEAYNAAWAEGKAKYGFYRYVDALKNEEGLSRKKFIDYHNGTRRDENQGRTNSVKRVRSARATVLQKYEENRDIRMLFETLMCSINLDP